ncbi:MAG: carbohydrate kinase [Balneolaceae bacterium]|nr:carbohydrate kinase [Balneolaceae bacterium]
MKNQTYLLGYDIGSSSIKASLLNADNGQGFASAQSPRKELEILSPKTDWAEQDPETWWTHVKLSTEELLRDTEINPGQIAAIGITYQMHGLVLVDKNKNILRPSIIWCDSRAAGIGKKAFETIGPETCLKHFLNSPGNFTASKLKWVQENEPQIYEKIDKIMLPGDYIAMKLTDEITTTVSGLSEGVFWDYTTGSIASLLLDHYNISEDLLPEALSSFETGGHLTENAAKELGLKKGTPVTYRAGDQPNNAFSLNALNPGEAAANAGTSGVIYGVSDQPVYDEKSRVNTFVHVNHQTEKPRYGVLLCINGTGILYRWIKEQLIRNETISYEEMNNMALNTPIGSDGITVLPFGNGAERILENKNPGAHFSGVHFNRHKTGHLLRAAQEGIVHSLNYGFTIMNAMEMKSATVKAGRANMFLSPLFREAFVNTTGSVLELYNTDGAEGAARGAGMAPGIFSSFEEAFEGLRIIETIEPDQEKMELYGESYQRWLHQLNQKT